MFLFKFFSGLQVAIFRLSHGRLMSGMRGMPILLLNTVGRKTRQPRTTPLMYIQDGEAYVVTASNNGSEKNPGWYYNLIASPQVSIEVPGKRIEVTAAVATSAEHERLWAELVAQAPFYNNYQKNLTRQIPMIILKPTGANQ